MFNRIVSSLVWLSFLMGSSIPCRAQDLPVAVPLDFQIYNGVLALMKFPVSTPHILIANTTLSTACGEKSGNPVLINGCGMFGPPVSVKEVEKTAKESMPRMSQATWQDFTKQNSRSSELKDVFQSPWPHKMSGVDVPQTGAWNSPDGAMFFSRVGFDHDRKQALVYVVFFSYMKDVRTTGNFFLFASNEQGHWEPIGRLSQMESQ